MNSFLQHVMDQAFAEAKKAFLQGEVPVSAIVFDANAQKIISSAYNQVEQDFDPSAHAELLAIRKACATLGQARLYDLDLYVTLEPCPMCATVISFARIRRLYFGAYDIKSGGVDHGPRIFTQPTCHHSPEIYGGLGEQKSTALLKEFFSNLRIQDT